MNRARRQQSGMQLCPGCLKPAAELRNRCPNCGEPIAGYSWLGVTRFFGSRYGRFRRSGYIDRRPKLIYILGPVLSLIIVGPIFGVLGYQILTDQSKRNIGMFVAAGAFAAALLWTGYRIIAEIRYYARSRSRRHDGR